MGKTKFAALAPAMMVAIVAVGCNGFPRLRRPSDPGEAAALSARPGPMKQLANSVSESSFGQSVSKVFRLASAKKRKPPTNDPTSLATKVKPMTPEDYVKLGDAKARNDDAEGAREMFHKALAMRPHDLEALISLGRLFDRQGQLDRATEHYLEAIKYHPTDAKALNDLAMCLARQGKYEPSAAALRHAIELKPDSILYRNNIATVLVAQGRNDEALAHLVDAHGPAVAHCNLGWLLYKQGRRELAIEQYQLALAADPAMERARQSIDALTAPPEAGDTPSETGDAQLAETEQAPASETPRLTRRPMVDPAGGEMDALRQAEPSTQGESEKPAMPDSSPPQSPSSRATSRRRTVVAPRQSGTTTPESLAPSDLPPDALQPLPPVDASSVHPNRY